MAKTQVTDSKSNPVLSKLLEADSSLAVQENELMAQVEAIREKRHSLLTVINLFSPNGKAPATKQVAAKAAEVEELVAQLVPAVAESPSAKTETAPAKAKAAAEPEAEPAPKGRGRGKGKGSTAAKKQPSTAKKGPKGTRGGRKSENWQSYVRDQFRQTSLTVAVSTVMQQQPTGIFEVPDIIDAIFSDDMPGAIRTKARDRILHVLSAGVRDEQWYRGKMGQYSLSRNAAVASRAAS